MLRNVFFILVILLRTEFEQRSCNQLRLADDGAMLPWRVQMERSPPCGRRRIPKLLVWDERSEGYGLRRQSAAATALWAARGSLVLVERSAGLTPKRRRASLAAAVQKVTNNFGMHGVVAIQLLKLLAPA